MPITKEAKKDLVSTTTKLLEKEKESIVVSYKGLSVEEMQELRGKLREAGVSLKVIKNTLLARALKDAKIEGLDVLEQKKPLAIAIGDDEVAPVKIIVEFAKDHKQLELISGAIDRQAVAVDKLQQLAALPGREEMIGQVVGTIAAPLSGFVRVLAGTPRALVQVLKSISEAKS